MLKVTGDVTMKKRRRRKHNTFVLVSAAVLVVTSAAICTLWFGAKPNEPERVTAVEKASDTSRKRPAYPYSVVPGGVYSAEEFSHAAARDSVVAAHYLVIDGSRLRATNLGSSRSAYVSYRVNNAVYWTKRPVNLPKGERVLSDGESLVRARCGNRISAFPRLPVLPQEPAEIVADQVGIPGQEPVPGKSVVPSFDPSFLLPAPSVISAPDPSSGGSLTALIPPSTGMGIPPTGGKGALPIGGGGATSTGGGSTPSTGGGSMPSTGGGSTPSTGGGSTPSTGGGNTPPTGGGTLPSGGGGTATTGAGGTPLSGGSGKPPTVGGSGTTSTGGGGTLPVSGTGSPPVENKGTPLDPGDPSAPAPPGGDSWRPGPADIPSYAPVTPTVNVVPEPSSWILLGSIALWFARTLKNRGRK